MSRSKYTPRPHIEKTNTKPPVPTISPASSVTPGPGGPGASRSAAQWTRWVPVAVILAAIAVAYANALRGPFIFDDIESIVRNESIRNLWSPEIFNPPGGRGETVGGRPLLNASFAVNYAISGLDTWSYHAMNVAIHALAALVLFGLARRTIEKVEADVPAALNGVNPGKAARRSASTLFALAVALVWALHPLVTGAVSYVVQRAESLCGLFYLLAVYCFARAAASARSGRWLAASVAACFAGVATKEVAATIPVIVFLYDRTFVAGGFAAAWRVRRGYYIALMASWGLLALLALSQGGRGMSAGYAGGMNWWEYALTQCWAVARYLRMAFWPAGQLFDYGIMLVRGFSDVFAQAMLLAVLLCATVWALVRKPVIGFLGAWFFVILAPTSSVVPVVTQTIAEHRMYLPLIAVVALVFGLLHRRAPRFLPVAAAGVALLLGATTIARNVTYRSDESVWRDVAKKNPLSARAWTNLGVALQVDGRVAEARECYERAISLNPNHAFAHSNTGVILMREGKMAEAIPHLRIAARLEPDAADMRYNLGMALAAEGKSRAMAGRMAEAEALLREAVAAQPDNAEAHGNLGNALLMQERVAEALREYEEVLRLKPDDRGARENIELAREFLRQTQR